MLSKLKLFAMSSLALLGAFLPVAHSYAAQVYDFSSSTDEVLAMAAPLRNASMTIVFGAVAILVVAALAFMGAGWVWSRFKKFTGIKNKI